MVSLRTVLAPASREHRQDHRSSGAPTARGPHVGGGAPATTETELASTTLPSGGLSQAGTGPSSGAARAAACNPLTTCARPLTVSIGVQVRTDEIVERDRALRRFLLLPVGDENLVSALGLFGCLSFLVASLLAAVGRCGLAAAALPGWVSGGEL